MDVMFDLAFKHQAAATRLPDAQSFAVIGSENGTMRHGFVVDTQLPIQACASYLITRVALGSSVETVEAMRRGDEPFPAITDSVLSIEKTRLVHTPVRFPAAAAHPVRLDTTEPGRVFVLTCTMLGIRFEIRAYPLGVPLQVTADTGVLQVEMGLTATIGRCIPLALPTA